MTLKLSEISLTSYAELVTVYAFNQGLSLVDEVVGRLASLILSPAAALEIAFHGLLTVGTFVYSIGKSLIYFKLDMQIPWEHLQRVRNAAAPLFFGSVFGLIHPYAGIFMTEPKEKHTVLGILLSGSSIPTVCSPVASLSEIRSIGSSLPTPDRLTEEEGALMSDLISWEADLEKIQSLEIFDLRLTTPIFHHMMKNFDGILLKEIVGRVVMLADPIFATAFYLLASTFCLMVGAVQWIGGKPPTYFEVTLSPETHLYNLIKCIVSVAMLPVVVLVGLISPEKGLDLLSLRDYVLVNGLLSFKGVWLKHQLKNLEEGKKMALPIVTGYSSGGILPAFNSHMLYLLIEKKGGHYEAELIERGACHRRTERFTLEQMFDVSMGALSFRYRVLGKDFSQFAQNFSKPKSLELGQQPSAATNCIITNLLATLDVMRHKKGATEEERLSLHRAFKKATKEKFAFIGHDFYPFASLSTIMGESEKHLERHI